MASPSDRRYTREHEWILVQDDSGTVGITDYAQGQLGDIVFIDLPAVGTQVQRFARFGEIESVKAVSELYSPASGEVVEANQRLIDSPELVNQDPFGEGWLVRLRLSDPAELADLMTAEEYDAMIAQAEGQQGT